MLHRYLGTVTHYSIYNVIMFCFYFWLEIRRCKGSRVGNLGLTIKAKFLKPNNISFASYAMA